MIQQISSVYPETDISLHPDTLWVTVQFKDKFVRYAIADVDDVSTQVKEAHRLLDKAIAKLEVIDLQPSDPEASNE